MKIENKPSSRKKDILVQKLPDETLVYDLNKNKAYCLNETSALIWGLCDGRKTITEIAEELSKTLGAYVSEELVSLAVDHFVKDELLEQNALTIPKFEGLSRREVIRKVGLASAVALPLISAIAAPVATQAQSCSMEGELCTGLPTCCPGMGLLCFSNGIDSRCQCVDGGGMVIPCP